MLAICSEADAFVAAGLTQFSLTARLAFLVVGPMVDVKLVALQVGTFGRSFAARFAPLTFVAAVGRSLARRVVAAVTRGRRGDHVLVGAVAVRLGARRASTGATSSRPWARG